MKYVKINLLLCSVIAFAFLATGCPRPKSTTVNGSCTRNTTTGQTTCTVGGSVVFDRAEVPQVDSDSELIVDVPDGWSVDTSSGGLDFKANSDSSQPQITAIPLTLTTLYRDPIDAGSSTKTLVGNGTAITSARNSQSADYESEFIYEFPAEQLNCNLPTGEYTFHFRYRRPGDERSFYMGAARIAYDAGSGPSCTGSSAIVK